MHVSNSKKVRHASMMTLLYKLIHMLYKGPRSSWHGSWRGFGHGSAQGLVLSTNTAHAEAPKKVSQVFIYSCMSIRRCFKACCQMGIGAQRRAGQPQRQTNANQREPTPIVSHSVHRFSLPCYRQHDPDTLQLSQHKRATHLSTETS